MTKRRIVFFGNCQAQYLAGLSQRFLAPRIGDEIDLIVAPVQDMTGARHKLASADIIVEQVFDHTLEIDIAAEFAGQTVVRFPNVYAIFYWPYTNHRHPRNDEIGEAYDAGPYGNEMGDSFLNRLIAQGVSAEEALRLYLADDMSARAERMFEINGEMQRKRDAATGFDVQGEVERHFRDEHLFLTSAHPNMRIFSLVAQGTLRQLGYEKERIRDALTAQRVSPFPNHALPIHPRIIEHFGLSFATAETRYPFFEEGSFTFAEYVRRYMKFEWNSRLRDALLATDPDAALIELDEALKLSPRSATAARTKCDVLLRKRDYPAAIESATQATELAPDDPRNWLALSRCQRLSGARDAAGAALERARRLAPIDADIESEGAYLAAGEGNWPRAVEMMRRAVDIEPGSSRFYFFLSDFLAQSGQLDPAIEAVQQAIALDPEVPGFRLTLADRLDRAGRTSEALAIVRGAIAQGNREPHTYARLGHFLGRTGDIDGAIAAFREAAARAPSDAGIRLALADMLDRKGDSTGAATIAGDLVAAGSRDAHIHARLGHFRDRTGDPAGAEAAYRKAVELAPDVSPYRIALSGLAERAGRLTEAIAVIEPLNGAGSLDPHLHARLGQLLSQTGDLAGSEAALRQAAELAPDEPGFGRALANLLDRQNRSHEALVIVEQLVATGARDRDTLGWLGHLRARTGNLDGAEITLREALGVASADPALQLALADTLDRKGRTDEALTVVKGVVTAGTRDRHTYGRLGKLLVRAGDFDGAETAYRQAIELAPEETGLRFALADTLDRKGRTEEAISIVREMVAAGMRDRQTYRRLGNLLSRVGELTAANAAFRQADGMGS